MWATQSKADQIFSRVFFRRYKRDFREVVYKTKICSYVLRADIRDESALPGRTIVSLAAVVIHNTLAEFLGSITSIFHQT